MRSRGIGHDRCRQEPGVVRADHPCRVLLEHSVQQRLIARPLGVRLRVRAELHLPDHEGCDADGQGAQGSLVCRDGSDGVLVPLLRLDPGDRGGRRAQGLAQQVGVAARHDREDATAGFERGIDQRQKRTQVLLVGAVDEARRARGLRERRPRQRSSVGRRVEQRIDQ